MFKTFLRNLLKAMAALSARGIVHADLKPDNILVETDGDSLRSLKLIDFGSSFAFNSPPRTLALGTPEYMPPEALDTDESAISICERSHVWSYDMWALGCIWIEIASGFPLWLSLKAKVDIEEEYSVFGTGFFAVPGREHAKINQKQLGMLKIGIPECAQRYFESLPWLKRDRQALDLLSRMLAGNPRDRISPLEALEHPFLRLKAQKLR